MARFSLASLFVVVYPHTDSYDFDTGEPSEVFTTEEEAKAYADECDANLLTMRPPPLNRTKRHYVETLVDRLARIKDECRSQGEANERRRRIVDTA